MIMLEEEKIDKKRKFQSVKMRFKRRFEKRGRSRLLVEEPCRKTLHR